MLADPIWTPRTAPRRRAIPPAPLDVAALAADLAEAVRGEVRFDAGTRALYATDASNYRHVPIGIVVPRDADDVAAAVAVCRAHGAPILPRGGGTSLAGQCCNVAVVLDFSKYMHRLVALDAQKRTARVEPGIILDDLRAAAEHHTLTFGPDPSTHDHCVLGGMIGNNACGVHALMAGKTSDNVEELEILTYDGLRLRVGKTSDAELEAILRAGGRRAEIYRGLRDLRDRYASLIRERYPNIPRRVSGYNLVDLLPENGFHVARALVGSEGTCVTVLEATLRLVYSPPGRSLLVLGYPDVYTAADHVPEILEHRPIGLEGIDDHLVGYMEKKGLRTRNLRLLPEGRGWLLVELGGKDRQESHARAREVMDVLARQPGAPSMRLFDDPAEEKVVWKIRESGLGATAFVPGEPVTWEGWEDSAVPPERLGKYMRDFRALLERHGYRCSLYGHFGQGCLHTRIDFDFFTARGIRSFRAFVEDAADLVVRYGGSFSGEHGDGQSRAELLPKMFGPELVRAFEEFKAIWDPDWKMNPGKIVRPHRLDEDLRLGTAYRPPEPRTHFAYTDDGGSFANAALRCVGVGECRRLDHGVMCPSFMVTREEEHATRGRAHLLFEMLQGDPVADGWRSEAVREALDLCLACKGCKRDCPVNVDMATYKAEFLAHHYAGRLRPRAAYAMGLIYWWARAAARLPGVANLVGQTPGIRALAKTVGGIAPARRLPRFASEPFTRWFARRPVRRDGRRVILWPDTFTNYFHPEIPKAAVEVLEAAGCAVRIPPRPLCCGRPLYDWGMLDLAARQLRQILDTLRDDIAAGVPIVALEPSCLAVFRDELAGLFPDDMDAKRLREQSFLLSELLRRIDYRPPRLGRKAVVHLHCHHHAVLDVDAERDMLDRLGLDFTLLDAGCCGMAGSFGFEKGDRYDVAVKAGERKLLPAVRSAPKDTLILADGFSCQEQIAQLTDRRALHLAQVVQMALRERTAGPAGAYPERRYPAAIADHAEWRAAVALGAIAVAGAVFVAGRRS